MKHLFATFGFILTVITSHQAVASATIWKCEGTTSKMGAQSAFMSTKLHTATLQIDGEQIGFSWEQLKIIPGTELQRFELPKYTVLFIPQSSFFENPDEATAIAVVLANASINIEPVALDTLNCTGH